MMGKNFHKLTYTLSSEQVSAIIEPVDLECAPDDVTDSLIHSPLLIGG